MASLHCGTLYVDYSLSGHVREFEVDGKTYLDPVRGIREPGWERKLWDTVCEFRLNVDADGHGLHAFVYPLIMKYFTMETPI